MKNPKLSIQEEKDLITSSFAMMPVLGPIILIVIFMLYVLLELG